MPESNLENRLLRLERARRSLIAALLLTWVGGGTAAVTWYRHLQAAGARPAERLVNIATTVDSQGLEVTVPYRIHPAESVRATVRADDRGAFVSLGVGSVAISESAGDNGSVVSWTADGSVTSSIEVDTDTGAWTLHRSRYGSSGKILKEEQLQLIGPLGP